MTERVSDPSSQFPKENRHESPQPSEVKPVDIFVAEALKNNIDVVYVGSHKPKHGPLRIAMPREMLWNEIDSKDFVTNHIIAPKEPLSDPEQLKVFMDQLVDDGQFADKLLSYNGVDYPRDYDLPKNTSLSVGKLLFKEDVGEEVTQVTQELNEAGKKLNLPIKQNQWNVDSLHQLTIVSVYPNEEVASLLMDGENYLDDYEATPYRKHVVAAETLRLHSYIPSRRALEKTKRNLAEIIN